MMQMFEPHIVSTNNNYKYFYRGQYEVRPDPEDISTVTQAKKRKLQAYEQCLKRFEYKQAVTSALATKNPEVVVALFEELVERNGLHIALGSRSEAELVQLLEFLVWKISDHRFSNVLVEVARITLDIYAGVVGLSDKVDYRLFN